MLQSCSNQETSYNLLVCIFEQDLDDVLTDPIAGDFITIGPTAIRAFKNWPTLYDAFHKAAYDTNVYYHKQHGEVGAGPRKVNESFGWNIIRPDLHKMLMDTVLANGIGVRYLQHVVEFLETPDKAG